MGDRPRVLINCAASLDGKIAFADRSRARLSSEEDLARVHEMRNAVDAIIVGVGTILTDDPSLAVKEKYVDGKPRTPAKVILDSSLRTPPHARALKSPGRTIIFTAEECQDYIEGIDTVRCGKGRVDIDEALTRLKGMGMGSVMVEGGSTLIWAFLRAGLWDELTVYYAPLAIGGEGTPSVADGPGAAVLEEAVPMDILAAEKLGEGILVRAVPRGKG